MNKKTIDTLYKWILRFFYARILILGISLICFAIVLIVSDYRVAKKAELNTFIAVISGFIGLILFVIGIVYKTETEYGIRNKWHEKDLD